MKKITYYIEVSSKGLWTPDTYFKFKCELTELHDGNDGYWENWDVKYCDGPNIFSKWIPIGIIKVFTSGSLAYKCEDYLKNLGYSICKTTYSD